MKIISSFLPRRKRIRITSLLILIGIVTALLVIIPGFSPSIFAQSASTIVHSATPAITPVADKQVQDVSSGIILFGVLLLSVIILGTLHATYTFKKRKSAP